MRTRKRRLIASNLGHGNNNNTDKKQLEMRLNRKCLNRFETIFNILTNSMRLCACAAGQKEFQTCKSSRREK